MDYFLSAIDQKALNNKVFLVFGPYEKDNCNAINKLLEKEVFYNEDNSATASSSLLSLSSSKYPNLQTDPINNLTYIKVPSNLNTLQTYFKILNQYILNAMISTAQIHFLVVSTNDEYLEDLKKYVNTENVTFLVFDEKHNHIDQQIIDLSNVSSQNIDVLKAVPMTSNYDYVNKLVSEEIIYKTSINSLTTSFYYTQSDQAIIKGIAKFISDSIIGVFNSSLVTMFLKQTKRYPGRNDELTELLKTVDKFNNPNSVNHNLHQLLIILSDLEVNDNYLRRLEFFGQFITNIELPITLEYHKYFDSYFTMTILPPITSFDLEVSSKSHSTPASVVKTVTFNGFNISIEMVSKALHKVDISSVKLVLIQAVNTVTFDSNLSLKCDLSIICPTWIVLKPCLIDLSGTDGKSGDMIHSVAGQHLKEGYGVNGTPGDNGSNGYCFQGVGAVVRGYGLTVNVSGGNGGKGGNGSKGHDGMTGVIIHTDDENGIKIGVPGKHGGSGGYGGWSGNGGEAFLCPLLKEYVIIVNDGKNGQGGIPGEGGLAGKGWNEKYTYHKDNFGNPFFDLGTFDPVTGNACSGGLLTNLTSKPTTKSKPVTMKTMINYEQFLVDYLYEKNIVKDIALDVLLKVVGGGDKAMFNVGSSLGVVGMIDELTLIHTCYWNFLFLKDNDGIALTATELSSLYKAFINKFLNSNIDGDEIDCNIMLNLYTSALAALNSSTYTIIDLKFLDVFQQIEINNYDKILDDYRTNSKSNEYCDSILEDINQALTIVGLLNKLGEKYLESLRRDIGDVKVTLDKDVKQNQDHVDDANRKRYLSGAGIITNVFGKIASNFGPVGGIIGGVLGVGGAVLGAAADTSEDTVKQLGNPVELIDFDPPVPNIPKAISSKSKIFPLVDVVNNLGVKVVDDDGNQLTLGNSEEWKKEAQSNNTKYFNEQKKRFLQ